MVLIPCQRDHLQSHPLSNCDEIQINLTQVDSKNKFCTKIRLIQLIEDTEHLKISEMRFFSSMVDWISTPTIRYRTIFSLLNNSVRVFI